MLLSLLAGVIARLLHLVEPPASSRRELPPEWFKFPMY
jgi:hypothetical protein